jgi:hypothetical protein
MQCPCAILSSVTCAALQYFSILYHKRHDFRKKYIFTIKRVFYYFPYKFLSDTFLIIRRSGRDMIKNARLSECKVPVISLDFNQTCIFLDELSRKIQIPNFMKSRSMGTELFHANRWTDGQT